MPQPDPDRALATVWTIVVAGGKGERFGGPKQYEALGAGRVLDRAVRAAAAASAGVVVVVPSTDTERERASAGGCTRVVAGGSTRTESVRNGLHEVPAEVGVVCVHDAARPFAGQPLFDAVIAAVRGGADAAVPGIPVTDTIKRIDADGVVIDTPPRDSLVAVQTPQAFRADVLRDAHARGGQATDDASLVEEIGGRVVVVAGDPLNRKITDADDLAWARALVAAEPA